MPQRRLVTRSAGAMMLRCTSGSPGRRIGSSFLPRKPAKKRRTARRPVLGPYLAAVAFDDAFDNGKSHPFPGCQVWVKALKYVKQSRLRTGRNTSTVVTDPIVSDAIGTLPADGNAAGPPRVQIFERIGDEIGEHLTDSRDVAPDGRHGFDDNFGAAALDRSAQRQHRRIDDATNIDDFDPQLLLARPRQQQQGIDQALKLGRAGADVA